MKPVFELKILQCDGSVKAYNERPWWLDIPIQPMNYPQHHTQKKHEKISATMSQIEEINREAYIDSLLAYGRVLRKNEKGLVTIREVAERLHKE